MANIPTSERFFQPEISKVYWLPTIAATTLIPSRAEITAGTDLTNEIADVQGFTITAGDIKTPDLGARFDKSIPGRTSVDQSALVFYGDLGGQDVRTVLTALQNGFLVFCDGGDVTGYPADVFPVRVKSIGKLRSTGDNAYQLTVGFTVTSKPAEDVDLPATA